MVLAVGSVESMASVRDKHSSAFNERARGRAEGDPR